MSDYTVGDTIYHKFTSKSFATGIPTTLSGTPVVSIYEDGSVTQITAGITLTVDFDSVTGLNHLTVVATGGNGFEIDKFYQAVITTGTVGGLSVVGDTVWTFSLGAGAAAQQVAGLNDVAATDIVTGGAISTDNGVAKSDPLYNGAIHVDSINGVSGTTVNTNGTERDPVAGMADVLALSASTGINTIKVAAGSSLTLTGATTGKLITGSGWTLDLSNENTDNSTIRGAFVSGVTTNTALVVWATCQLDTVTSGPMHAIEGCYQKGTYTSSSTGPYGFDKIRTVEGGNAKFDFNGINNTDATYRQFSGIIDVVDMGSGNKFEIEGRGTITLEASCTDGAFASDGDFHFTNNGSGIIITLSDQTDRLIDIEVDTGTTLPAQITALNNITAADVLAAGDADGFSLEESLKLLLSASTGILSGAATNTITIQAADGSKTRLTATVDVDGNRSVVVKDATG